jgi:hypothetical protein
MTKDRIYSFTRKLQGAVKRARQIEANIDDGEGYKAAIADIDPAKALELGSAIAQHRADLAQFVGGVDSISKRQGLEGAEELMTDLGATLQLAEETFDEWRSAKARYELASLNGDFAPDGDERGKVSAHLSDLKKRYEAALELASNLVPSPGVIQL